MAGAAPDHRTSGEPAALARPAPNPGLAPGRSGAREPATLLAAQQKTAWTRPPEPGRRRGEHGGTG
ncbi:hypothetical protein ACWD04_29490 [Streptomyces sp. NPDC002911]